MWRALERWIGFEALEWEGELLPHWAQVYAGKLRVAFEEPLLFPEPVDGVSAAFRASGELAQRFAFELRDLFVERGTDFREHNLMELCGELGRKLEPLRFRTWFGYLRVARAHRVFYVFVDGEAALAPPPSVVRARQLRVFARGRAQLVRSG